jgi:pimeloyl-ACP methyl ester carboxylesterase
MSTSSRLHCQAYGPDDAASIVFLHGGGVAGFMWQPVIERLPEYHCLAPDLPQHGGSQEVGPFSMQLAAEQVAALICEQAHGARCYLVGLSEGAQVSVQVLANAPELIGRALISSALLLPLSGLRWLMSPGALAWTYRLSVAPFKRSDWWIRINMKYSANVPEQLFPQFKQAFVALSESAFVNIMLANQRFRMPAGMQAVNTPALIVVGHKEYAAMHRSARELAEALPQAKPVQLNLGRSATLAREHNWALTEPDLFAETVRAWIEGQPLPPELRAL